MSAEFERNVDRGLSVSRVVEAFFRHKKKAMLFALAVVGLAAGILLVAPRKYRSESRLFLQVGRESVRLDPTATTGSTIGLQQSGRDAEVATAMEVLRSRAIIEKTVDILTPEVVLGESGTGAGKPNPIAEAVMKPLHYAIGLVKSIDPISKREEAVILIERNLEVDAEHESTVISLTYDAETAVLAQQVLATLVEAYRDEHVRLHQTHGSKTFFVAQQESLEKKLEDAEEELRAAKTRMGLASIDSRRSTLENRLATLELSRNEAIQGIASAEAQITSLEGQTASMPEVLHTSTTIMPNTGADSLRTALYDLQVQLMDLEAKYNEDHPLVKATRLKVDEAKSMIADESDSRKQTVDSLNENHRALSLSMAQAETRLSGLEAQLAELDEQRDAVNKQLLQLNQFEVELQDLERAVNLGRNNFYASASKMEQARIDEELDNQRIMNINVAQFATLAEKPISPSKLMVAALSLLLLSAGTTALVLGSESLDSRISNEDQVEQLLGIPVLASVPDGRRFGAMPRAMK